MNVYVGKADRHSSFQLLQTAYHAEFGSEIKEADLYKSRTGKPFFKDPIMPFFSISHSGDYIACVFDGNEIGLDLQKIKRIPPILASRYLGAGDRCQRDQIREWTKFESYGKRLGCGIPLPEGENYNNGYYIHAYEIPGYILTVCVELETDRIINLIWL